MDIYTTETEQLEVIKKWLQKYGKLTLLGLLLVLILSYCWRYYLDRKEQTLARTSIIYEHLLSAAANNDMPALDHTAKRLLDHYRYRHTPYAQLAALMLARQAVYQGQLDIAEKRLNWIMKHGNNRSLRQIARIRLARVLLAENQPEKALSILKKIDDEAYLAFVEEVRGDVYQAMDKTDDARKAYQDALTAFPEMDMMQPLLRIKLDNLAAEAPSSGTT